MLEPHCRRTSRATHHATGVVSLLELSRCLKDALCDRQSVNERSTSHVTWQGGPVFVVDFDHDTITGEVLYDDAKILAPSEPFMSGELLTGTAYNPATIIDDEGQAYVDYIIIMQTFYHDLESIFWIMIWLCLAKGSTVLPRPVVASGLALRDADARHAKEVRWLFEDVSTMARYKRVAITVSQEIRYTLGLVDDFLAPVVSLLEKFCSLLAEGYATHDFHFDRTFDALKSIFGEAECRLLKEPEAPLLIEPDPH